MCKKSEKTNDKISRKHQKTGFSGIMQKNLIFENRAPSHFGHLRQCEKFHKKISSTARDIQEILFFRQKLAIPAIFWKFRLQKSVFLTIETCLMVGIVISNLFVWKNNEYEEKIRTKSAKMAISGTFPVLQIGKIFFSRNGFQLLFCSTNAHLCAKNYKKLMIKYWENPKKTTFFRTLLYLAGQTLKVANFGISW